MSKWWISNEQRFKRHQNFVLLLAGWGDNKRVDIVKLLDSVVADFYAPLDGTRIPTKSVKIHHVSQHKPSRLDPIIHYKEDLDLIYLSAKDRRWSQYAFQFSHELCHHVMGGSFINGIDQFGWLEESLCELASIYNLRQMSESWKVHPPYQAWKTYSGDLLEYVNNIQVAPENQIAISLDEWLQVRLPDLYDDRYKRQENTIVALGLLPIFQNNRALWRTIQYFISVDVTIGMELPEFLCEWERALPQDLREAFSEVRITLVGPQECA